LSILKYQKKNGKKIEKIAVEKGRYIKQLSYDDLIRYKFAYELGIENKQNSALEAHRRKKSKKRYRNI